MKIKQDFVTNSSSTSFCVWGYRLDFEWSELSESFLKKAYEYYTDKYGNTEETPSFDEYKERIKKWNNSGDNEDLFYNSIVEFLENKSGLDSIVSWEAGEIYIGGSPFHIPNDILLPEYKKQILKKLLDLGLDLGELQIINEVIYS